MNRTLIVFDMDTRCLEAQYHHPNRKNAYADIQRILKKHGFTNIQGTVYNGLLIVHRIFNFMN